MRAAALHPGDPPLPPAEQDKRAALALHLLTLAEDFGEPGMDAHLLTDPVDARPMATEEVARG